jgi:hypothetical protein
MKQYLLISGLLSSLALTVGCANDHSPVDSRTVTASNYNVASVRREIISHNVLAAQLAPHHEFEAKNTFAPSEPIQASLYLINSPHIEPRRISAFLVRDEVVIDEQSIALAEDEERQDFDFRFAKEPRPTGTYQIQFVEIARSSGKPVLLARLFLSVE